MQKLKMFLRLTLKSFKERKSRIAIAFFAIVVGIGVITSLFSVYYDINLKMSKEMRAYGANMILTPDSSNQQDQNNKMLSMNKFNQVVSKFSDQNLIGVRPNLYGIIELQQNSVKGVFSNMRPAVMVGTWFDQVEKVNPYWKIEGELPVNREVDDEIVLGKTVAEKLGYSVGEKIKMKLSDSYQVKEFIVAAVIESGSDADNQVFVNLKTAQKLLNKDNKISAAYLSVLNYENDPALLKGIENDIIGINLNSIKKIASSESKILDKIKSLMYLVVIIILLSTLLCVSTTMMTIVTERKEEIGLKKSLGADNKNVIIEFLTEAAILGGFGGLLGYGIGYLGAQIIGQSVFGSFISFRLPIIPFAFFLSVFVACLASIIPVRLVIDVDPAVVLKGE
ncbi:putative ABC transport system permease protein [Halanaerobium saccharolyticum]|uniref:Putative ABC transport system permease protein n=1 Tax=Halanaerobium saccharolyticum TaxID=43595 RepID=A0A4V3G4M6_9FIRM|nr:ABC transporter permease [Halanaerobium saccharolyticum]RAK10276.1 putative ABC transport system permease protein [Halanaerobium saccharolyticum]TDW00488.1 putative ABC transport system permease protein [Halanaerobium saccharolyticum]TDX52073.1 putative ABC transport system permease protein [Halanaerobium saccharolyticum]